MVGGISRTESYKNYAFDLGGHRFFTKFPSIEALWRELLGPDLTEVRRISRIFYHGRFIDYPLSFPEIIRKLGPLESLLILGSYLRTFHRSKADTDFQAWVTNRFGKRLFETFFKDYTEKVWGIPCRLIEAEWAEQRIKGLSFLSALTNALFGGRKTRSLIKSFLYPRRGPGQMWQRLTQRIQQNGGDLQLNSPVVKLHHDGGGSITSLDCRTKSGTTAIEPVQVISSMPITSLVTRLSPEPPEDVLQAAKALKYRGFLLVVLILKDTDLFPDQWIYVHDPTVRIGRIQNYRNWSPDMVPDPATSSLGVEFFCNEGDPFWSTDDAELISLAARETEILGLASRGAVLDGTVIRIPKAYPVYELNYRKNLSLLQRYTAGFHNLHLIGRNGNFRYNNMDQAMLSGLNASRKILGKPLLETSAQDSPYLEDGPNRTR